MQVRFSNELGLTLIFQRNAQRLQSKTILRHLNKNEENMLHDSIFKKKGIFITHIKTKNIFSTTSVWHGYSLTHFSTYGNATVLIKFAFLQRGNYL